VKPLDSTGPSPIEDEREAIELASDPEFVESIARARAQVARGEWVEHGELMRELGLDGRPIDEADLEALLLSQHPEFLAILERARAESRAGLGLTPDEARRALGL